MYKIQKQSGTLDLRGETLQLFKTGTINSGQLSNRLTGSFRSPTFELNHTALQMKLQGKDVTARMILDGFFMYRYNGLLFSGFSTSVNSDVSSRWHRLQGDVHRYKGHKAFIEFLDTGNGSVSIEDIRQAIPTINPTIIIPIYPSNTILSWEKTALEQF